jgi:hypothetical protein
MAPLFRIHGLRIFGCTETRAVLQLTSSRELHARWPSIEEKATRLYWLPLQQLENRYNPNKPGSSYQTKANPYRYSELVKDRPTLEKLWILRIPPYVADSD